MIQGLTEFLPVSSSGHLVIGQLVLKLADASILLDAILHVGTMVPVVWLYRREVLETLAGFGKLPKFREQWNEDQGLRLLVTVVIATMPTGLMGIGLKSTFEKLFHSTLAVGIALLITGALLLVTVRALSRSEGLSPATGFRTLTAVKAFIVGIAQGFAITPGISRSGSTIATSLLLGVEREMAARFSFLMSLPAIVGATILQIREVKLGASVPWLAYGLGALASAIAGYLALRWVVAFVKRGKMHWFTAYVWPLGIGLIVYSLLK
ncbi:MAG: undecaprenyl-diphosphate phosphatase [Myxococcales bacterium]|nr:undecaprenyl-diphosphate phosphatase [Myxococcales bacterium]